MLLLLLYKHYTKTGIEMTACQVAKYDQLFHLPTRHLRKVAVVAGDLEKKIEMVN